MLVGKQRTTRSDVNNTLIIKKTVSNVIANMGSYDREANSIHPLNGSSPPERMGSGSDVLVFDRPNLPPAALSPMPTVTSLNAYKSTVHVGTKIELHDGDIIKGRFFGLDLVQVKNSRRLRCSIAVFVCWTLVVATALTIYLVRMAINWQTRLDLDLPCPQYVWNSIRSTSRAERLTCAVALLALVVCGVLVIYYVRAKDTIDTVDVAPHEWNITRKMWLAQEYVNSEITYKTPLKLVVIQHTVSNECHRFTRCAAELRNLQAYFIKHNDYDIPYNFIIGNDGRVYEGRGWNVIGAHTYGYNSCSVGIGFVGDYREEEAIHATVTDAQLERCLLLLDEGVRLGYLDPNYLVVGATDLRPTASPGSNLYKALKKWSHYDHENRYKGKNCTYIQNN